MTILETNLELVDKRLLTKIEVSFKRNYKEQFVEESFDLTKLFVDNTAIESTKMKFHHFGCLVADIDLMKIELNQNYGVQIDKAVKIPIVSQGVTICFVAIAKDIYIELVQPDVDNVPLNKMLKNGIDYYHFGYLTEKFPIDTDALLDVRYKKLPDFQSEAFSGKKCAFFKKRKSPLIELIEA